MNKTIMSLLIFILVLVSGCSVSEKENLEVTNVSNNISSNETLEKEYMTYCHNNKTKVYIYNDLINLEDFTEYNNMQFIFDGNYVYMKSYGNCYIQSNSSFDLDLVKTMNNISSFKKDGLKCVELELDKNKFKFNGTICSPEDLSYLYTS